MLVFWTDLPNFLISCFPSYPVTAFRPVSGNFDDLVPVTPVLQSTAQHDKRKLASVIQRKSPRKPVCLLTFQIDAVKLSQAIKNFIFFSRKLHLILLTKLGGNLEALLSYLHPQFL